jgi:hypothetical protein
MTSFALALTLLAGAQIASGWTHVTALTTGAEIRVELDAERVYGQFRSANAGGLTLRADGRDRTNDRVRVAEVWTAIRRPDKKTGGLLIAGGVAGMILGAIAKPPEAGPSAGFYVGAPLIAAGAFVQHHKRPDTLIYRR